MHLQRLLDQQIKHRLDTTILLSLAREVGYYPSVLFCYLMEKQIEQYGIGDRYNLRIGRKWIPMLDEKEILDDLPIFPDVRSVERAAKTLEEAGYVKTERTGAFLDRGKTGYDGFFTGRARDKWPWWHVTRMPDDYHNRTRISALEAAAYGMSGAVILAHWRTADDGKEYRRLSAAELEKILPMDEKTIRRQLKALVEGGALLQHPLKRKLYRLTNKAITIDAATKSVSLRVLPKVVERGCNVLEFHREAPLTKPAFLDCHAA